MKKQWSNPTISELEISNTQYSPVGGTKEDGIYKSRDGVFTIPTFGSSNGNSGTPTVEVK